MPSTPVIYRAAARLGRGLAPTLALLSPKLAAGHSGRSGAAGRLAAWAAGARDPERPLVWFHASSVGEGLQAESVLLELRTLVPGAQYIYTHYSPSAAGLARRLPVDAADYLPYDLPAESDRLLDALRPSLLVFAKLDLWPELATRAAARGTAVAMVAATVSPGSGRLRWPARPLLQAGYRAVAAAAAVSQPDAERLARLGVPSERIQVLGDPRFDSVLRRVAGVAPDDPLLRLGAGAPTLVAGSTWPADEAALLRAFAVVRERRPDARLILVPHEPTERHLAAAETRRAGRGPPPARATRRRHRPGAAAAGGSGRGPRRAVWRGDDGLRRRGTRHRGPALGAGAGRLGASGRVRAALGGEPRRRAAAGGGGGGGGCRRRAGGGLAAMDRG